jgi:hypothetical protein
MLFRQLAEKLAVANNQWIRQKRLHFTQAYSRGLKSFTHKTIYTGKVLG